MVQGSTHDFGSCDVCSSHAGVAYDLVTELADVLVLETSAARLASSILAKVTIKCVVGQVLKSLGRNPRERELKSHPILQMVSEQVRSLRWSEKPENMVRPHEKPLYISPWCNGSMRSSNLLDVRSTRTGLAMPT